MKHTSGPWLWRDAWTSHEDGGLLHAVRLTGGSNETVAESSGYLSGDIIMSHADAHLIAAAPELLALLKKAAGAVAEIHGQDIGCPDCPPYGDDACEKCPLLDQIEAALAKAEGRS